MKDEFYGEAEECMIEDLDMFTNRRSLTVVPNSYVFRELLQDEVEDGIVRRSPTFTRRLANAALFSSSSEQLGLLMCDPISVYFFGQNETGVAARAFLECALALESGVGENR